MSNWQKVRLGDICTIKHGYAFKGEDFCDFPTKYILTTPGNFRIGGGFKCDKPKYYNGVIPNGYVLKEDDIIVTMTDLSKAGDTLGYSALIPYDNNNIYLHNQRVGLVADINDDVDKIFLYWLLRTRDYQQYIVGCASGSTVKHTSPKSICNYTFLLPPLAEQERIAGILGALDDKIECNNRINRNLEEQAAVLFRRWFVDFEFPDPDPTSPTYGKPYKSSGGKMQDSPLDSIPQGWQVGRFTDIVDILGGGTPNTGTNDFWNGEIPFFTPKDAKDNIFTLSTEKYITKKGLDKCNSKLYPAETVFITARGTVGKVAIAGCDMAMNQSCYALSGKNGIGQYFVYHITKETVSLLRNKASGAVFDAITTRDFESEHIIIPSEILSIEFSNTVKSLMRLILSNTKENQTLATLRDTLLPKLMNNEICIDDRL